MRIEPEIVAVDAVLVGNFNPAIFTPAWFELHALLPKSVIASAKLKIAHSQVTAFSTDWLSLNVLPDRFIVNTSLAPYVRVRDLVVRMFKEHLFHTPLRAFGINLDVHFQVESFTKRDQIGRILAPVGPWVSLGQNLRLDGKHGGMTSLTMSQTDPEGRPEGGRINVTVEPSNRIGHGALGIYVRVNDHYAIDKTGPGTTESLIDLFENNFDGSLRRSDDIVDHIMSLSASQEV